MNRRRSISAVLAGAFALVSLFSPRITAQGAAGAEPFRDGDRWCAVGDSITHGGTYHEWVDLFYLTRYPDRTIAAHNCGISGDTAGGGVRRVDWDVLAKNPTVCSIMFGMNDIGRALYDQGAGGNDILRQRRERIDAFRANLTNLVGIIQNRGARVLLLTPSIYDQTAKGLDRENQPGADDALAECAEIVRLIAVERGAGVVDFHGAMARINRERQASDPGYTLVGPDRVHPGAPGHFVMAYEFLRAQGVTPLVARLSIDLTSGEMITDNGVVADVRKQDHGGLRFTWTASALPFPVDEEIRPALGLVPFTNELNQEILQISGLRAGKHEVRIDDTSVGVFTAEQLGTGINLATIVTTPQYEQAMGVLRLVKARGNLVSDNLRGIAFTEFRLAPDYARPLTLEQMEPFIAEKLATLDPTGSGGSYVRRQYEVYPALKEREKEAIGSADRMARLARLTAQPRSHIYLVRPAR